METNTEKDLEKKTKTKSTKSTTKKTKNNDNIDILEILKKMEEMQKQIEDMKEQNKKLSDEKTLTEKLLNSIKKEDENSDFKSDDEITVISQTVGGLNLTTSGNGEGALYRFTEFGEIQDIPFGDLKEICKHMKRFAQQGAFYIANDKAVEKLRLKTYYNRMISNDDMLKLFEKDANTIISLYNLATDLQKEQIISLIENERFSGREVDSNVLTKLGELSGKDLIGIGRE